MGGEALLLKEFLIIKSGDYIITATTVSLHMRVNLFLGYLSPCAALSILCLLIFEWPKAFVNTSL